MPVGRGQPVSAQGGYRLAHPAQHLGRAGGGASSRRIVALHQIELLVTAPLLIKRCHSFQQDEIVSTQRRAGRVIKVEKEEVNQLSSTNSPPKECPQMPRLSGSMLMFFRPLARCALPAAGGTSRCRPLRARNVRRQRPRAAAAPRAYSRRLWRGCRRAAASGSQSPRSPAAFLGQLFQ